MTNTLKAAIEKPRYRTPTHTEYVTVSLNDFGNEEIAEHLRHEGFRVDGVGLGDKPCSEGMWIDPEDMSRIDTLALCGQKEAAREWILDMVGKYIGRDLT